MPWFVWLITIMAVHAWLERGSYGGSQRREMAMVTLIPLAIWGLGTLAIAWKNHDEYGVFAVVELKTPQFKRAFGNLIGIKAEQWHPRYAAQPDVLDKLYSLPSGGELDLDHRERNNRRPIHSLMLPWKFRSAVADAGYYEAGGQAVLNYYDRLGQEIESACAKGRFECEDPLLELLPPWHPGRRCADS